MRWVQEPALTVEKQVKALSSLEMLRGICTAEAVSCRAPCN